MVFKTSSEDSKFGIQMTFPLEEKLAQKRLKKANKLKEKEIDDGLTLEEKEEKA